MWTGYSYVLPSIRPGRLPRKMQAGRPRYHGGDPGIQEEAVSLKRRGEESRLGSNAILGRSSESGLRLNFRFGDPTQIIPFAFG